jgi:tetratricopeptide (TPR) repeat protein
VISSLPGLLLILMAGGAGPNPPLPVSVSPAVIIEKEEIEDPNAAGDLGRPLSAAALCVHAENSLQDGSVSDLLHARSLFKLAAQWYPSEPCGHAGLARAITMIYTRGIEEDDGLVEQALSSAQRAVDLDAGSAVALAALAAARFADLRTEEARSTVKTALAKDPDSVAALQIAATIDVGLGRFESGRVSIARAIKLRPDLPISLQIRGNLQLLAGETAAALDSYRSSLTLADEYLPALMQLAAAYEQAGDLQGSGILFQKILQEHPEQSSRCHLYMGWSLMRRNSWKTALGTFEKVSFKTRRGLCDGTVIFFRGMCYAQLGRDEEARSAFREVIDKWPDATGGMGRPERLLTRAYEEMARLAMKNQDTEGAATVLEEGAARPGAGPDLHVRLAGLYMDYNMPDKALALLEKAASAELEPRSAEPIFHAYLMGVRLAKERRDQAAIDRLVASLEERAIALAELHDYVLDLDAVRTFSIAGRGSSALACLKRAVEAGYSQLGWIESDEEMESLRKETGYAALVRSRRRAAPSND